MSEESSVDHYAAVLADLEAQRDKIEQAIATIKALQGTVPLMGSMGSASAAASPSNGSAVAIEIDTFHALTVAESIKKYLAMRPRKPVTTADIVEALKAGGQSGAEGGNFPIVVTNSLNRMSASDGEVSKVRRGVWGLKSWYGKNP